MGAQPVQTVLRRSEEASTGALYEIPGASDFQTNSFCKSPLSGGIQTISYSRRVQHCAFCGAYRETRLAKRNCRLSRRSAPCTRHSRSCHGRRTYPQTTQLVVWAGFDWLAGRKGRPHALCPVYCDYLAPLQRHRLMSGMIGPRGLHHWGGPSYHNFEQVVQLETSGGDLSNGE